MPHPLPDGNNDLQDSVDETSKRDCIAEAQLELKGDTNIKLRLRLFATGCVLALLVTTSVVNAMETQDIVALAKPSLVFIHCVDTHGHDSYGTGFVVTSDGLIVTCAHVVRLPADRKDRRKSTSVKTWARLGNGDTKQASVIYRNDENDIAILRVNAAGLPALSVEPAPVAQGEEVIVLGYPLGPLLGKEASVTRGIVSALRDGGSIIQLDAAMSPGNSGGPVLNKTGKVVGIAFAKLPGLEGMNFAISSALIPSVARPRPRASPATSQDDGPVSLEEQTDVSTESGTVPNDVATTVVGTQPPSGGLAGDHDHGGISTELETPDFPSPSSKPPTSQAKATAAGAPTRISVPSEGWLGIYMSNQKMGYMHMTVDKDKYEGRDCYRMQSFVRTKLVLLGTDVQQDVKTLVYTDERFAPTYETFEMASGGRKTSIEARFTDKEVKCKVKTDSGESNKVVPIPEGASLIGDSMYALGTDKLKVGLKAKMHYFNPLTLSVDPIDVEVLRTEQVEIKGAKYDTFVVKNVTPMGDMTSWQAADGSVVKAVTIMGLTMQIESAADAVSGVDSDYVPPADLAIMTSVKANMDIPKPEKVKKLVLKLTGKLERDKIISDQRQKVRWLKPKNDLASAEFTVESDGFDPKKSVKLPIEKPELVVYLEPTPYIECNAPEIKEKAAEIVGDEKSAYAVVSKIRAWVSSNMKPQADIGIVRPSVDVLRAKVGVCRDYAVLFTALARAAGVPTKVAAGLVYMNGNFYYHAWAESYVGRWVAFDATQDKDFVDATHIKLTEGDATNMFEMARVFGSLKAEIVHFE
ncbi:MAG: trypsin-like peptidase domain-containing protein [Armatimonadetes bacterium]|nr:trypsin-like peptidase domain-containing protein [Armatimonadota bacterium]